MNTVETPVTYQNDDDVIRLKLEYSSLMEEVAENNRKIHEIQIRDIESLESMKYHVTRKRELNERIRQLKKLLLERYVDRQGSMLKIDEWMAGLKISSPPAAYTKSPENRLINSLDQFYNTDALIGDINGAVEQNTEDLLAQLSFKIDHITKSVNSSVRSELPVDETRSRSESSVSAAQRADENAQKTKMEQTMFLLQHLKQRDPSSILSPIKLSPSSLTSEQQHQTSTQQSTPRKRCTNVQTHPIHRLNYPANVELRSIKSPPILPHKRKTCTTFTTKHNITRKQPTPIKTSVKHKHVGDYIVHSRNPATVPLASFSCGTAPQSQTNFCGIIWTVVIIISVSLLFYMYPSLLNMLLLLKDGAEQTRDEVTRILDSIIIRAGGDPWWSTRGESEIPSSLPSASPASTWSSLRSASSAGSTQSAAEQSPSAWQTLVDYATAVYRYILYD